MTGAPRLATPGWSGLFRVAIVGAASLKGKELKDTLEERNFPSSDILLLDDDESLGLLDQVGDEATFVQAVTSHSFDNVDVAFFAGDADFTRRTWRTAAKSGAVILDLSYALDGEPGMAVRSPWIEQELEPEGGRKVDLGTTAALVAHPAATMLGMLLLRARAAGGARCIAVTLFEPVSERGRPGMDELHQQTMNLLSFQPMPKAVFGAQLAFNLISRFGDDVKESMQRSEEFILAHLSALVRGKVESPALQLVQAPIFHGHAAAIYVELERKVTAGEFALALQGDHLKVVASGDEQPTNVNVAGQHEIQVAVREDASRPNGLWLWAAADNLKLQTLTAHECALELVATRPSGKIQ
ncbi:MAG: segregation protein B [Acidobacteriales bacterium]|nr:segregation protein B [Terriglobales bacterium]